MRNNKKKVKEECCDHWYMLYQEGSMRAEAKEFIEKNIDNLVKAEIWGRVGIEAALLDTEDIYKCVYCRKEIKL